MVLGSSDKLVPHSTVSDDTETTNSYKTPSKLRIQKSMAYRSPTMGGRQLFKLFKFVSFLLVSCAVIFIIILRNGDDTRNNVPTTTDMQQRHLEGEKHELDLRLTALKSAEEAYRELMRQNEVNNSKEMPNSCQNNGLKRPKVWPIRNTTPTPKTSSDVMTNILRVFRRLGYDIYDPSSIGGRDPDWAVMWSLPYPFDDNHTRWSELKTHQRINHFPTCGTMLLKARLVTEDPIPEIPRAFRIPQDKGKFLAFSAAHPDRLWVQKSDGHRGIKIVSIADVNFMTTGTFVQEYIDRPLLVDGRRFDIGVYALMTSLDPLRVYVYEEWHMRFCPEPYYPFNANNSKQYVVTTHDNIPPWDMPSLKKYFVREGVTRKHSLLSVLREKGVDTVALEKKMMDVIIKVYVAKEPAFLKGARKFSSIRNFFEMVRFDFVIDEDEQIYLMEVNMSPILFPGKYSGHKLLHEQVVYSVLSLVGAASPGVGPLNDEAGALGASAEEAADAANMFVAGKDIYTYTDHCVSPKCADCAAPLCQYCRSCLTVPDESVLKAAFMEHTHRQGFQRLFPRRFVSSGDAAGRNFTGDEDFTSLNARNQWMTLWYRGKCIDDSAWCS